MKAEVKKSPNGWHFVALEEISEVVSKGTTPTTLGHQFSASGVPFLRAEDVTGGPVNHHLVAFHVSQKTHEFLSRSQLRPGDLLITIAGTLGRVGYVPHNAPPLNCNQAVAFVRLNPGYIDIKYANLICQSPDVISPLLGLKKVGTIGNLNLEQVRGLQIPLPSLKEQKRIALVLGKADKLRRTRRYVQQLGDTFLQSVFFDMFGDPVKNPRNFDSEELGDSVEAFEGGVNFTPTANDKLTSEWRVLKISAVTWGDFNPYESKPINRDESFNDSLIVKKGDLLISRANTTELVGAVCMVRSKPPKVLLPDKLWRIKFTKKCKLEPEYVLQALRQPVSRKIIGDLATGSSGSMKNISKEKAATIPIMIPPGALQKRFARIVQRFERVRTQQREATRQAERLFQTLLHRAFRGEL